MLELHNVRIESSNVRKKKSKEPPNVRKELSHVMLELHNVRMELSNIRKKVREPPNIRKELSHVMLKLHNVRKKSKGTAKCEKKTITCDVGTAQCED